jgi:short-subunit dehydrogenase
VTKAARTGEARKALITGGSSGIGAATARAFAARGFTVAVTGRDRVALQQVADETRGISIPGDMRERGCPQRIVKTAAQALGMLADVLRAELRADGIRVTLVTPGVVDTAYFERRNSPYLRHYPRPISPQVVADAVVEAVEHSREAIVVPGWLSWPARLKVSFPALYRLLESRFA